MFSGPHVSPASPLVFLVSSRFFLLGLFFLLSVSSFCSLPFIACQCFSFFWSQLVIKAFLSVTTICVPRALHLVCFFAKTLQYGSGATWRHHKLFSCFSWNQINITSFIITCIRNVVIAIYIPMTGCIECISVKPFIHFNCKIILILNNIKIISSSGW